MDGNFFFSPKESSMAEERLEQAVRIYAKGPLHPLKPPKYRRLFSANNAQRLPTALSGGYTTDAPRKKKKVPEPPVEVPQRKPSPPMRKRPKRPAPKQALEEFMDAMDAKLEATLQDVHDQLRASDDDRRKQLEKLYEEEMQKSTSVNPEVVAKLKLLLEDAQTLMKQQQATADQAAVTIREQQRRIDDLRSQLDDQRDQADTALAESACRAALLVMQERRRLGNNQDETPRDDEHPAVAAFHAVHESSSARTQELEAHVDRLKDRLKEKQASAAFEKLQETSAGLEATVLQLKADLEIKTAELDKVREKSTDLEASLKTKDDVAVEVVEKLRSQVEEKKTEVNDLAAANQVLKDDCEDKVMTIEDQARRIAELETSMTLMKEEVQKKTDEASKEAAKVKILEAHAVRGDSVMSPAVRRRSRSNSISLTPVDEGNRERTSKEDVQDLKRQLEEKTLELEAETASKAKTEEARDHAIEQAAALQCRVKQLTDENAAKKKKVQIDEDSHSSDYQRVRFPLESVQKKETVVRANRVQMSRARRMSPAKIVVDEIDILKPPSQEPKFLRFADDETNPLARLQAAQRGRATRRAVARRYDPSNLPKHLRHDDAVVKTQSKAARLIQSRMRGRIAREERRRSSTEHGHCARNLLSSSTPLHHIAEDHHPSESIDETTSDLIPPSSS